MLIPVLTLEDSVQTNDLTRFNASKSIKTKDEDGAFSAIKIKAGADGTDIDVMGDPDKPEEWYLDWAFESQSFDIDSTNNVVNFSVQGVVYRALVAAGTYTLANLLIAVKNTIEAAASPLTVTVTKDDINRITLTPSLPLLLLLNREEADLLVKLNFYDGSILKSLPVEYGIKQVTLTVELDTPKTASIVKYIKVLTPESDRLFCTDADLAVSERDIMNWVSDGRASYLAEHRKTQTEVLEWLFKEGIYDDEGRALTKWSIVHTSELRQWAKYKTLAGLMLSFSNAVDDIFMSKYKTYSAMEGQAKNIYSVTLDRDNDGVADAVQDLGTAEGTLIHR